MSCGYNNTMAMGRPTQDNMASMSCNSSCSDLGPTDPLNKNKLGPRKNREKVREQIKDYVLLMLGAPVVKIELDQQQLDLCVDQALKIFEDYAGREYFNYYVFKAVPGQSVYTMPPDIGLVRNVFYKEEGTFPFQASDLNGAIPLEYYYPGTYDSIQGGLIDPIQPMWGKMGEWVLYKQYQNMYSRVSSNLGGWEYIGAPNTIKLYPIPYRSSNVIVHYMQNQKDWLNVTQAMTDGALAHAKIILGRIRSKYQNVPGVGGGVVQDGQQLLQEGREDLQKWYEDLIYKFGDILPISLD